MRNSNKFYFYENIMHILIPILVFHDDPAENSGLVLSDVMIDPKATIICKKNPQ